MSYLYEVLDCYCDPTDYVEASGDLSVEAAERLAVAVRAVVEGRVKAWEMDVIGPEWWDIATAFQEGYQVYVLRHFWGLVSQDLGEEWDLSDLALGGLPVASRLRAGGLRPSSGRWRAGLGERAAGPRSRRG